MNGSGYRRWLVPALLWLAGIALLTGMVSPVIEMTTLGVFDQSHSLVGGVVALITGDSPGLGLLIGGFSIVLPIVKLVFVARAHQGVVGRDQDRGWWLVRVLGKWSMLDVFVVATVMGCIQLGLLSEARAQWGIAVFALGVLLSMLAAGVVVTEADPPPARRPPAPLMAALRAILLGAGISLPLMRVEKWWFWQQDFSLLGALPEMTASGEWFLPMVVLLFVIGLPIAAVVVDLRPRWQQAGFEARGLQEWSMLDVFVISMLLVFLQLGEQARIEPQMGFWFLTVAVVVGWLDEWLRGRKPT